MRIHLRNNARHVRKNVNSSTIPATRRTVLPKASISGSDECFRNRIKTSAMGGGIQMAQDYGREIAGKISN
jgi:hypothetical protein